MSGKLNKRLPADDSAEPVRVVVERREVDDPAGELALVQLLADMLDRRRHSRGSSKG